MDNLDHWSECDLIERCKNRDDHAWRELVERHQRSVRLSIREKLGEKAKDMELVEDLTQNVFVALIEGEQYKRLGLYDLRRGCLDTFLRAIASQVVQRWRAG